MDTIVYNKVETEAERLEKILLSTYPQETVENASIASFSDGADGVPVKALAVAVEPVQDLHGYDAPWPGGGGKNLFNSGLFSTSAVNGVTFTLNSDGTITTSGTATATAEIQSQNFDIQPGTYKLNGVANGASLSPENYNLSLRLSNGSIVAICSVDGADTSFTVAEVTTVHMRIRVFNGVNANNLVFKPMIRLSSVSDATFAPYSNVCPISGWTGAKVTRTGKNLLPVKFYTGLGYNYTVGQVITLVADESVTRNGNVFSKTVSTLGMTGMISEKLKPGTYKCNIAVSADTAGNTRSSLYVFDENFKIIRRIGNLQTSETWINTITISEGEAYIAVNVSSTSTGTVTITSPQIEIGSTATAYEPYKGQTYEVTFPTEAGTVYGGTLDVVSGKLVVDRAMLEYDGSSDENWTSTGSMSILMPDALAGRYGLNTTNRIYGLSNVIPSDSSGRLDSNYCVAKAQVSTDMQIIATNGFGLPDNQVSTWRTYLNGAPLQICYKLASAVEVTLSKTEILTLLGANNIWADAGNVKRLAYRADLGKYIDSHITVAVANAMNA